VPQAISLLSQLIENYQDSELHPHGLYQRIHVNFAETAYEAALEDAESFLARYSRLPLATHVLMWLGDHYANLGRHELSEQNYLRVTTLHPRSELAPVALYEAAHSAYRRGDLERAALLCRQFKVEYADVTPRLQAQVALLKGDVLAQQGQYAEALTEFEGAASNSQAGSALVLAAKGRAGDMHYSLGPEEPAENPDHYQQALAIFDALAGDEGASADLRERAAYRRAKTHEKLGNLEDAIDGYLDIFYEYDELLKQGKIRDWFYPARSAFDAARLLVMTAENPGDYRRAARTYERLAASGVPGAKDAQQRAIELRRAHDLDN